MEARASLTVGSIAFAVGIMLAACVGDDPAAGGSSSGSTSSGAPGTSSSSGGGSACSTASPCASGTCVDGYCCDSPCTGLCEACNVKGSEGKCAPVTGKPLHGKCDGDADGVCAGSCDGKTAAACTYPEVACGKGSCAGGEATVAGTCKAGTCPAPTTQKCVMGCFEDGCLGVKELTVAGYPGHACAILTDGKVRCWGANDHGQLGLDPAGIAGDEVKTPMEVSAFTGVKMLAAVGGAMCGLFGDGSVQCVGRNETGQLGRGGAVDPVGTPSIHFEPKPVVGITGATFVSSGSGSNFCAIVAGGEIRCWGYNSYGQLGNGIKSTAETTPVSVCAPGSATATCTKASGAKFVRSGDGHTCAIFANDEVACWGQNNNGEAGQPASPAAPVLLPKFVLTAGGAKFTATSLTAGAGLTCAVSAGGAACWGGNGIAGRIGNCDTSDKGFSIPQTVGTSSDCKTPLSEVTGVSTYDTSVCGLAGGAVKCWGTNEGGQLGDGNSTTSQSYAATTAIAKGAVQVASGGAANYAVVIDGANRDVRCWGGEADSQCGTGTVAPHPTPAAPKW